MATESLRPPSPNATRHDSFTLTRHFDAAPAAVFALFADDRLWRKWFRMPGSTAEYAHDFQVGGLDVARSAFTHPDGRVERLRNRAIYLHIEPDRRIIYAYDIMVDDLPRWASLVTIEIQPDQGGTELAWTEQVAFITATGVGRHDLPHLRGGIQLRLNARAAALDHLGHVEGRANAHARDPLRYRLVARPHQRPACRGEADEPGTDLVTAAAGALLQPVVAQPGNRVEVGRDQLLEEPGVPGQIDLGVRLIICATGLLADLGVNISAAVRAWHWLMPPRPPTGTSPPPSWAACPRPRRGWSPLPQPARFR